MSELSRTPLHDWHAAHGGRMVDFAGWSMPVQYGSIVDEHQATRTRAGLFDISHMGRIDFTGGGACKFLDRVLTRRISDLAPGAIRYSLVTNEQGGILDDVLAYRMPDVPDYMLVVNASNRVKILNWLEKLREAEDDVEWIDRTQQTAMIAVQGPMALGIVQGLVESNVKLDALKYYSAARAPLMGQSCLLSRTGYTGEDGCEIIIESSAGLDLWQKIWESGSEQGLRAAGLGARDTLRLEAGMPLYGHELSEDIDPFQADLAFAVQLKGRHFIGREALAKIVRLALPKKRIGLTLEGKRVPREKYPVVAEQQLVGEVTSGTFSPTLEQPIAMAFVSPKYAEPGWALSVDIRGKLEPAQVVKLPFYRRTT